MDVEVISDREAVVVGAPRGLVAAFSLSSFLAAFLLFLLEPMTAKMLLPSLGGSPAVWNTAMVFFQATLLAGYAAAHVALRRMRPRAHAMLQVTLGLLVIATLPVALPAGWQGPGAVAPALWTLFALLVMVGAPFALLATFGPTLQRWFSYTSHPSADDPYFLYAAGNAGSLLALIAYPSLIEPALGLTSQARLWAVAYIVFLLTCVLCGVWMVRYQRPDRASTIAHTPPPPIDRRRQARWVFFAFIPSALLLGVTRYLSDDIAAVPLLWVVPLSLYLVTFIVAFSRGAERVVRGSARVLLVLAIPLALSFIGIVPDLRVQLPLQLGAFTAAALLAHGRLAADRPDVANLTRFYLWVAVGGVLGGIFAALIAPVVFNAVMEYPISIALALALVPAAALTRKGGGRHRWMAPILAMLAAIAAVAIRSDGSQHALTIAMLVAAVGLIAAFAFARSPSGFAGAVGAVMVLSLLVPANTTLFADRTFFGVSRVYRDGSGRHILVSGTTVHGIENTDGASLVATPGAYYSRQGPVGDLFDALGDEPRRIAAIGAGAGTLASYLRREDTLTFFEIDGAVERIATDPTLFSYVHDSPGRVDFVLGDGRLEIGRSAGGYDLTIVDAFGGDAIPTHLLTQEAVRTYVDKTAEHGLIAVNISNRYFDLQPILGRIAQAEGLVAVVRSDPATSAEERAASALPSTWVVMARTPEDVAGLQAEGWSTLQADASAPLWTDDYTDLLGALVH